MNRHLICVILFSMLLKAGSTENLPMPEQLISKNQNVGLKDRAFKAGLSSGILPGTGQFLQRRYFKAGTFLAFEAVSGSVAYHYYDRNKYWLNMVDQHKALARASSGFDSVSYLEEAFIAKHSAKIADYRMYNALSWVIGGYIYNVLDAIGGVYLESSKEKDPVVAGWLAAIPVLGLGQLYNGKLSKAGMVFMGQLSLGVMAFNNHRLMLNAEKQNARMLRLRDQSDIGLKIYDSYKGDWDFERNSAFRKRNTYLWYSLIFYLVNIFDAVVDAHLSDYSQKMRVYPDIAPKSGGALLNLNVNF